MLSPLGAIYGAVAARRMRSPGQSVGVPVICVGNLTVGGSGKTPAALAVARLLLAAHQHPFFLTRGYGGQLAGPVRVDPANHSAAAVGDEPLLLARLAPTIVARDRLEGARLARRGGATVIVMDDGFQNPALAKNFRSCWSTTGAASATATSFRRVRCGRRSKCRLRALRRSFSLAPMSRRLQ